MSERVPGPEHPDTLASVNNVALLLCVRQALESKGDYAAPKKGTPNPLAARANFALRGEITTVLR